MLTEHTPARPPRTESGLIQSSGLIARSAVLGWADAMSVGMVGPIGYQTRDDSAAWAEAGTDDPVTPPRPEVVKWTDPSGIAREHAIPAPLSGPTVATLARQSARRSEAQDAQRKRNMRAAKAEVRRIIMRAQSGGSREGLTEAVRQARGGYLASTSLPAPTTDYSRRDRRPSTAVDPACLVQLVGAPKPAHVRRLTSGRISYTAHPAGPVVVYRSDDRSKPDAILTATGQVPKRDTMARDRFGALWVYDTSDGRVRTADNREAARARRKARKATPTAPEAASATVPATPAPTRSALDLTALAAEFGVTA